MPHQNNKINNKIQIDINVTDNAQLIFNFIGQLTSISYLFRKKATAIAPGPAYVPIVAPTDTIFKESIFPS